MGLVADMFRRFEARQALFFKRLSKAEQRKLDDLDNKCCELRVTGPEGGLFYLQYRGRHFHILNEPPTIPYEEMDKVLLDGDMVNYNSGDEVLFDVISRNLDPRAVLSHKLMRTNTDRIIFDNEQLAQAFEGFLNDMQTVLGGKRQ